MYVGWAYVGILTREYVHLYSFVLKRTSEYDNAWVQTQKKSEYDDEWVQTWVHVFMSTILMSTIIMVTVLASTRNFWVWVWVGTDWREKNWLSLRVLSVLPTYEYDIVYPCCKSNNNLTKLDLNNFLWRPQVQPYSATKQIRNSFTKNRRYPPLLRRPPMTSPFLNNSYNSF